MRERRGVLLLLGVASAAGGGGGEERSGVEGGKGGVESRCSSISSKTLLSKLGGRDFFLSLRRSRCIGGLGGSIANDGPDTVGLSARWEVDIYPTEFRPLVVGIEKTEILGDRGNGSTVLCSPCGRAGTGGGGGDWRRTKERLRVVTVLSSSLSPKPNSPSSSEEST